MELKGTKTEKNLQMAFAGESQARNKYTYFAAAARACGNEDAHIEECDRSALCASICENLRKITGPVSPAVLCNEEGRPVDAVAFPYLCRSHLRGVHRCRWTILPL